MADVVESSFHIANLPLEEYLGDTPSQMFGRGSADTHPVPPMPGCDAISQSLPPVILTFCTRL